MAVTSYSPPAGEEERAFPPEQDTSVAAQSGVARLGLIGGVILVVCVTVLVLCGQSKSREFLTYLFLGGIAPMLAASLLFMMQAKHRLLVKLALATRLFLVLVLAGFLVLGGFEYANAREFDSIWPFLAVVCGSALAAAIVCRPRRLPRLNDPARRIAVLQVLDVLLIALLVGFGVFYSRFHPAGYGDVPLASDLVIYAWETPHFLVWVAFGLIFSCAAIWLWRFQDRTSIRRERTIERWVLLGIGLFVLGLFDDGLYINLPHYMVHVGPAMHARHGGIAMVDVYSIYGLLPWFVVKLAFGLLGPTFGTAALVVRLSQIATLIAMVLVLHAVSRRRLATLALMVPAVLVAVTFHPGLYNLGALPSTSGLRYLLPSLMVLVLVAVRSPVWSRWLGVGLLTVAALWSVETFVYTLAPWGYVLLLQAVRERSLRRAGLTLIVGLTGVVLAHTTLALGTFLATGEHIDYGPYLGQFARFRPDAESTGFWQTPIDRNFEVWVLVWLGYFLVLSAAGYRALQGRAPTDMASRLVPVAGYGFAALNYFMGTPTWPSLGLAFIPIAIVMICAMETLAPGPCRYGTLGVAVLLALTAGSSLMVAFGTERFARPVAYNQGNSSVLRRCLSPAGCGLAEISANLKRGIAAAPLDPAGPVSIQLHETSPVFAPPQIREQDGLGWRRIVEAVDIMRQWTPHQPRVAILSDHEHFSYVSMAALMQTGQWYRWPISSPLNDEISEPLVALILRRVAEDPLQDGEILIVVNDREYLLPLEQKILGLVAGRCRFVPLEKREFHTTFRAEACEGPAPSTSRGGHSPRMKKSRLAVIAVARGKAEDRRVSGRRDRAVRHSKARSTQSRRLRPGRAGLRKPCSRHRKPLDTGWRRCSCIRTGAWLRLPVSASRFLLPTRERSIRYRIRRPRFARRRTPICAGCSACFHRVCEEKRIACADCRGSLRPKNRCASGRSCLVPPRSWCSIESASNSRRPSPQDSILS